MAKKKNLTAQRKYKLLLQISQQTRDTFDLVQILNILLDEVKTLVEYDAAGIFVLNRSVLPPRLQAARQVVAEVVMRNYPLEEQRNRVLRYGEGLVGYAIRTGECVVIPDVRKDSRYIVGRASTLSEIDVPIFLGDRPIGALNLESDHVAAFSKKDVDILRFFADAAAITIDKAMLHFNLIEKEHFDDQLKTAQAVQAHLLPSKAPQIPGYDLAGISLPAYQIGGDYYDYIQLPDDRIGLVVADVSGDGLPAALVMASFRALLRGFALRDPDPSLIAETINRMLSDFSGSFDFVTCFYALFEPHSGLLTYVNCGHNPPIYVQNACQESSAAQALLRSGPALGMLPGIHYQASQLTLSPGDLLLMYTDGIVETRNAEGEFFEVQRLEALLCQNAGLPANELIQSIIQSARQFSGYEVFADDTALVVLRRNPQA